MFVLYSMYTELDPKIREDQLRCLKIHSIFLGTSAGFDQPL